MNQVKRLGIFATYCHEGKVDDYIIYYLSEIRKCLNMLVVVSNTELSDESKSQIGCYADYIYERDDEGYDVGGLRSVLVEFLGWDQIRTYDELLFMNDSVFGPFYPFEEVFLKMGERDDLDFWGLCKRSESNFDGGEVQFPEHIQLYFYVVRKQMLNSKAFEQFWNDIDKRITNFRTAIFNYEFAFTEYFAQKGYKWDVYCHLNQYETNHIEYNLSPYHYASYELIKACRCPVLKRKLFTGEFVEMRYSGREDLKRVLDFLENETAYDVDMIWKFILSNYALPNIMESLKLSYVLQTNHNYREELHQSEITVIKCTESRDIFDTLFEDVQSINSNPTKWNDIILLTSITNDRNNPISVMESEIYRNVENLVKNKSYIFEAVKLFNNNARLGVLVPPAPVYGNASSYVLSSWRNGLKSKVWYDELNLHVQFDENQAPVPPMTALLCKKEILDYKLIDLMRRTDFRDDLQLIPLYAQEKGYYTAVLQSAEYAGVTYFNYNRFMNELLKKSGTEPDQNVNEILDGLQANRIKEFCDTNEYVYIYGAGQLAERVSKIIMKLGKNFDCFVVTSMVDNVAYLCGHPVIEIENIEKMDKQIGFIVAGGKNHNEKISGMLKSFGYDRQLIF